MSDTGHDNRKLRPYRQVARADASRDLRSRIIDACIQTMRSGRLGDVTLDGVAKAAKTTRQTIIRLYGNRTGLIAAAVERWPHQLESEFYPGGPLSPQNLVETLCGIYETVGAQTLNFLALLPNHPELMPLISGGRERHRAAVDELLNGLALACTAETANRLRNEILVATDLYVWSLLRRDRGLSPNQTVDLITHMLLALIDAARPPEERPSDLATHPP